MRAIVVTLNTIEIRHIDVGDLGRVLGGYLESLPVGDTFTVFIDEDGIAKGLPRNDRATDVIQRMLAKRGRSLLPGDYIKGPAIFVGVNGDIETDLCHEVIDEFFPEFAG